MGKWNWTPQRTRCGLTLWTYSSGNMHRTFAMVRRDSDGMRVTRASFNRPVKPGRMPALHKAFDAVVTETMAKMINGLDRNTRCAQCVHVVRPYVDALHDALEPFLEDRKHEGRN